MKQEQPERWWFNVNDPRIGHPVKCCFVLAQDYDTINTELERLHEEIGELRRALLVAVGVIQGMGGKVELTPSLQKILKSQEKGK